MSDYTYVDDMTTMYRACYVGTELVWNVPAFSLEEDEEPFGHFAPVTNSVIHEEDDEPPFHETLKHEFLSPVEVHQVGVVFEDWPCNKNDELATMRVTQWANGEGFDIAYSGGVHTEMPVASMTYTRFDFLVDLVKQIRSM